MNTTELDPRQPAYPAALRQLAQPPDPLYLRGRAELLGRPAVAVIGARSHSAYGRDATVSLVVGLARAGYVIVSGLARGIDGVAHQTALEVGGDTVAVLGNGLDVAYPPEHRALSARIAEHGCLVSEFPVGTPPRKYHFPQRNRLIAALSRAVLVVEATERSGTLITVDHALEQGKEVFAVPGPIHNITSRGTNRLIQQGAGLVTSAVDVIRALSTFPAAPVADEIGPSPGPAKDAAEPPEAARAGSDLARRIWDALAEAPLDADRLAVLLDARPAAVAAALLELELAGLIRRLPGPRFARVPA